MHFIDSVDIERLVERKYKENIVFEWIKKPCLSRAYDKRRLSPASVFYICFEVLDTLKRYDRQDMYRIENAIECFPGEIEELIKPANYGLFEDHSTEDRIFLSTVLYAMLRIADDKFIKMCSSMLSDSALIFSGEDGKKYKASQQSQIDLINFDVMTKSAIYRRSEAIVEDPSVAFAGEVYLQGYIRSYMQSDERISDDISALLSGEGSGNEAHSKSKAAESVAPLSKESADSGAEALPEESKKEVPFSRIRIKKGKKQKTMAILSAMFYAGYFTSEDSTLTNREQYILDILQYGFGDKGTGGLSSGISNQAASTNGLKEWIEELRKALDEGLEDLKYIQNPKKTGKK